MASLRSQALIQALKRGGILSTVIDADNLEDKRKRFKKLEKYFPKPQWAKISAVNNDSFRGEWTITPSSRESKVLLYLHGGGFVFDSTKMYRDLVARLAKSAGLSALSVNYSLSPEHPYPKALNEAFAAYTWLIKQGYQPKNIALGGDSAGGALALSLLHKIREKKLPMPACVFVMSPATDATLENASLVNSEKDFFINIETLRFFIESYFSDTPTSHPIASPLHGSLKGFPPILMHVDKNELMYNDTVRFAEKARKSGTEVTIHESEGLFHVWHIFARYIPEAKKSIDDIGLFVNSHI